MVNIGLKLGNSINDFRHLFAHDVLAVIDEGYDRGIGIGFHCLYMTMVQKKAGLVQAMQLDHSFSSGMTSTDKSDLSSGFLWCGLYILIMGLTAEALRHVPFSHPWLLAAPHVVATAVCLRGFRASGEPILWKGQNSETSGMRVVLIVLAAAAIAALQSFISPPAVPSNTAAWIFAAVFIAPAAEEIFFRGMLFSRSTPLIRIPLQAGLFALAHLQLEQGMFAFAGGLVLGWIALEFGLVAAISVHGLANLFSALAVLSKEPIPFSMRIVFLLAAAAGFVYLKVRK